MLDERIVPSELVVGISGKLCFITYYENKTNKNPLGVLNSKVSWTNWSANAKNPLIVTNKFMSGFKLAGVNGRYSRNAANSENMLIMHPAFKKSFEISMIRFMEIAAYSVITNGVFDKEFIVTKSRDIVSREEYDELVKSRDKEDSKKNIAESALKSTKISSKNQIPGRVYKDAKNGRYFLFAGTLSIQTSTETLTKYIYLEGVKTATSISEATEFDRQTGEPVVIEARECPSLIRWNYNGNNRPFDWYLRVAYSVVVLNNKKQVSLCELSEIDMFEKYSYSDWDKIESLYNKVVQPNRFGYFDGWYKTPGTPKINFRQDYLTSKGQ